MSNGSSDGGSDNEGRTEGGSSVPQVFGEVFLVGDSLGDKDEVEGEGQI